MGLLDFITGGNNQAANNDLSSILADIRGLDLPTKEDLQLGPLDQYASTGTLNPALMDAAQSGPSAYDKENLSAVPMSAMQQVLARLDETATADGMTPQEKARIASAESSMDRNIAGQRGAIAQHFAGMGVPQSLVSAALQNQTAGDEAQQGYENALQAEGQASNNAQTALGQEGALASTMFAQQAGQANTVASAQNALNAFNANNVQGARANNQASTNAANTYNAGNAQDVANRNTAGSISRQFHNQVEAPTTAANLALGKTAQEGGVGHDQAAAHTAQGEQSAGLFGGLIGAGADLGSAYMTGGVPLGHAEGGEIPEPTSPAVPFVDGGSVPGHADVPGNAAANDTVPARLSPGEFVVPRTAMADPTVRAFLAAKVPTPRPPSAHPSDIASVMRALAELRGGA